MSKSSGVEARLVTKRVAILLAILVQLSFGALAAPRQSVNLDAGWRFIRQDVAGAQAVGFDDSAWQALSLPHTWNAEDGQDGGNHEYRGVGWYRRHLTVDPQDAGKSLFLRFDGAATVAEVFVNGKPAGTHRGNFGAFCFDVTSLLGPGRDNVVAVRVNNALDRDIPPLDCDFSIFGGLYRDVHLVAKDRLCVDSLDDASPGVYLKQSRGQPGDWARELDALHSALPKRAICISEYGAGASIAQHEEAPKKPKSAGSWHPEEWQCAVHEAAWKAMQQRPWLWATFVWNMFDFAADNRNEGDHPGRNDKGMVSYDRKVKKDAFFWYKANWTRKPFVYITDRRFTRRSQGPPLRGAAGGISEARTTVKVYSNCESVSLEVNGASLGAVRSADHAFVWGNVALEPGANRIEAVGTARGGKTYRDACIWTVQ